ncbi:MAG: hypothetical protein JEZ00_04985 [Anaerolineaceae bacterium]|nr:hypothetical protein [Anaerolineaceae bacterium]
MLETFGMLLLLILTVICLIALFLAIGALFPRRTNLVYQALEQMPQRALLLGLINTLFVTALTLGFGALAETTGLEFLLLLPLILLIIFAIALAFGLTSVAQMIGVRLNSDLSINRRNMFGSLTMIVGCLTPYIGWFGLFIYVSLLGMGSVILSFFRKDQSEKTQGE